MCDCVFVCDLSKDILDRVLSSATSGEIGPSVGLNFKKKLYRVLIQNLLSLLSLKKLRESLITLDFIANAGLEWNMISVRHC